MEYGAIYAFVQWRTGQMAHGRKHSVGYNHKKNANAEETMEIQSYLERIHYYGSLEPTLQTLRAIHEAHLLAVPFENLDIHLGREIVLDETALWAKIVEQNRGGFCYELNGLFTLLLRTLGFQVDMLSAAVAKENGGFGPEFDHLTLLVHLEEEWLADVGFGDSFRLPLRLQTALPQSQDMGNYSLEREEEFWIYQKWNSENSVWEPAYRFTLQPHVLRDFTDMCRYQQTSPESHFTQQRVCSLATRSGRITLSDQRLITTIDGKRTERLLSDEEYQSVLAEQFGMVLLPGVNGSKLPQQTSKAGKEL
jgi:N-hydroxyarylamine O-acetyltransferase